jgi:hypothetical protein
MVLCGSVPLVTLKSKNIIQKLIPVAHLILGSQLSSNPAASPSSSVLWKIQLRGKLTAIVLIHSIVAQYLVDEEVTDEDQGGQMKQIAKEFLQTLLRLVTEQPLESCPEFLKLRVQSLNSLSSLCHLYPAE